MPCLETKWSTVYILYILQTCNYLTGKPNQTNTVAQIQKPISVVDINKHLKKLQTKRKKILHCIVSICICCKCKDKTKQTNKYLLTYKIRHKFCFVTYIYKQTITKVAAMPGKKNIIHYYTTLFISHKMLMARVVNWHKSSSLPFAI